MFVFCNVFKQLRPNNWITFLPPLKRLKTPDLIEQFNSSHGFLIISLKRLRLSRTRPVIIILRIGTIQVKYMLLISTYPGIFHFGSNYQSLTPKQWTFPKSKVSACMCGFGKKMVPPFPALTVFTHCVRTEQYVPLQDGLQETSTYCLRKIEL